MRQHLARGLTTLAAVLLPVAAIAGGPLIVNDDGTPIVWDTTAAIPYRTDGGDLSALVNGAAAQTRVANMFAVWQNVGPASIAFTREGAIQSVPGFADGNVSNLGEFDAVEGDCGEGDQNPIIYDADGTIFTALGIDVTSVIGFAGPCAFNPATGLIVAGEAVMNGLFLDGVSNADNPADLTAAEFDATFVHEFGHFSGLDHSQINVACGFVICGADDIAGLPTMFPFLVTETQGVLSVDDIAWISRLYPAAGFSTTHGHITGTVFFSDGESHAQGVNVIARRVDNPATAGVDESRTTAGSNVSGYKFRFFNGNPINASSDTFGSQVPAHLGFFEIPLAPGSYMVEVESINEEFVDGSSVGGPVRIAMPGSAPAPLGPVTVTAGGTDSGNNVTLIGTAPRFDQFEGPGP